MSDTTEVPKPDIVTPETAAPAAQAVADAPDASTPQTAASEAPTAAEAAPADPATTETQLATGTPAPAEEKPVVGDGKFTGALSGTGEKAAGPIVGEGKFTGQLADPGAAAAQLASVRPDTPPKSTDGAGIGTGV